MYLRLDIDIQKLEAEKLKKGKNKVEEDLDSLKIDYKKQRVSMRTAGLGKTSEQWRREIQEERNKADGWEKKCQETQVQNKALERNLLESRSETDELKARIAELERSLHRYRNRNIAVELRASLNRIEETKKRVEELEATLQDYVMRVEFFEVNEERQKEQLHYYQSQVRDRDHVMGEAVAQIREVADYLQTLAVQADTLSVKYELELDRGKELASLFRKIKVLSIRTKLYL
ncbi:tropomyosin-1, isoforms 9A/A/B-like [Gossypium hirsutum]|uniref:Tropomyosin-1, isoforms 9A/A/B-like n=1 Tax=Gossypium hirsutum TaxID=3635 RepID=A0ABM3ABF6_GOSHI|nr:tropomyosin-1, isoforms 9A/A/B-like [Gossypium hirsutum]